MRGILLRHFNSGLNSLKEPHGPGGATKTDIFNEDASKTPSI